MATEILRVLIVIAQLCCMLLAVYGALDLGCTLLETKDDVRSKLGTTTDAGKLTIKMYTLAFNLFFFASLCGVFLTLGGVFVIINM